MIISAMVIMFGSCSDDSIEADNGAPRGNPVRIGIRTVPRSQTRAGETDNELVNSWWLVLVGGDNKVYNVIGNTPGSAVEQDFYTATVLPGSYTVYAFANISRADLAAKVGITFTEGATVEPAAIAVARFKGLVNGWDKSLPIPMSGTQKITVTEQTNQRFSIEVVRMLAKIEFRFTSRAAGDVQVDAVRILPLYKGDADVMLLPDYGCLDGHYKPVYGQTGTTEEYEHILNPAITVVPKMAEAQCTWFYALESIAEGVHPTDHFVVQVATTRHGVRRDAMYALAENLTYIYRNDHIVFPIVFTDYVIEPGVVFYPPIGGYPAVVREVRDDECFITFGTQGDFELYADVRDGATESLISKDKVTVEVKSIDDPDNILDVNPDNNLQIMPDPVTGELTGRVNTRTGSAKVKVEVTVSIDETIREIYTRTIYIIRKNE